MTNIIVLSKILMVRENEKNNAQLVHHRSIKVFEDIATDLYKLLKVKEEAEETYERYINKTTPVELIKEQATYIDRLNDQLLRMQRRVEQARNKMNHKQALLTEAHIEAKKLDNIVENRDKKQQKIENKLEKELMDDISIQQYLNKKIGE